MSESQKRFIEEVDWIYGQPAQMAFKGMTGARLWKSSTNGQKMDALIMKDGRSTAGRWRLCGSTWAKV